MSVEIIKEKGKYKFNQEAIDCIVKKYSEHKGSITIQRELKNEFNVDVSVHGIYLVLHDNNILIRNDREQALKYSCNDNFFNNIDTEEKAYWLGFIFADGSIIKTSKNMDKYNRLSICLSKKDEHHLEKFTDAIEYPKDNIKHANCSNIGEYPQSYVRINSIALVDDLISLNCNPNKTFTPSFPSNKDIPSNLIRDFVRGYFDGDGCISGKVKSPLFEITSELYAIQQLQGILMDSCNLSKTKLRFCRNSYTLRYGGINQIKKIFHYLYDGATVFLERKYKKFTTYVFTKDQTISF